MLFEMSITVAVDLLPNKIYAEIRVNMMNFIQNHYIIRVKYAYLSELVSVS